MRIRYRLMLGGACVLAAALGTVTLWPAPVPQPLPAEAFAAPEPVQVVQPPPAPPRVTPVKAVKAVAPRVPAPVPRDDAPRVTVARLPPVPVEPEPELSSPPPSSQDNDALEPELPQTAQWELEKTARLAAVVERDVVRLAGEREEALARGDVQRGEQLDGMLQRHLGQLRELHEEIRRLGEVVNDSAPLD